MDNLAKDFIAVMQNGTMFNQGSEHIGKKHCSICGKPYEDYINLLSSGITATYQRPTCTCEEEKAKSEENERQAKIKQEREEQERIQKALELSRRFETSLMAKRFRKMSFDTLDSTKNKTEIQFLKEYVNNFNKDTSTGIQLIGNTGTGKTSLLACTCNELIKQGHNCLFVTLADLLSDFTSYSSEHAGSIREKLNWLTKFDFIVLDDIAREHLTSKRREILFQLIDTLYNNESLIAITANPEMIQKARTDTELAAVLSRISAMCPNAFAFNRESLR